MYRLVLSSVLLGWLGAAAAMAGPADVESVVVRTAADGSYTILSIFCA